MKVVQTFCSFGRDPLRNKFGWYSSKFHLLSWALSSQSIYRYYKDITLFTDKQGFNVLIDKLHLPYKNVIIGFEDMTLYPKSFWGLAKIKTFSLQQQPFIHIDGDVYIRTPFRKPLLSAQLFAQNFERSTHKYEQNLNWAKSHLKYVPALLRKNIFQGEICACNAGIIGGRNLNFFTEYHKVIARTIDRNRIESMNDRVLLNLNVLLEQVLFYRLAKQYRQSIRCLFKEIVPDFGYSADQFANFSKDYVHLIGGYKRSRKTCEVMERRVLHEFPGAHKKVLRLFN